MKSIKFSKINIVDKDIKLVGKIIKSGWLTHGKFTADFENQFKKYTKSKYAVSLYLVVLLVYIYLVWHLDLKKVMK